MKNDYEMTLNGESTIIPCEDSADVPMVQCDFVSIGDLELKDKDSIVGKDLRLNKGSPSLRYSCIFYFGETALNSSYKYILAAVSNQKLKP